MRLRSLLPVAVSLVTACAQVEPDDFCSPDSPCVGGVGSADLLTEWTLLIYAANDDSNKKLVEAFDQDADEWQHGLGGSKLFRILVQRDYADFQQRPSERYAIYREQIINPDTGQPGTVVLGETDTSNADTLEDFLVYGVKKYPAKHYWVIVTGHGDSWNGLAFDATSGNKALSTAGLVDAFTAASHAIGELRDDEATPSKLRNDRLSRKIDVAQFDVCRLGAIEAATALSGSVDFMVASQEIMPDAGHPYTALNYIAQDHPGYGPAHIVEDVVTDYVRAYVEGVSTADKAYVGTSVTSVGLDLGKLSPLLDVIAGVATAVTNERPGGFSCSEVAALTSEISKRDVLTATAQSGRATPAAVASTDLWTLLSVLADPNRTREPSVTDEVREAAQAAIDFIHRPHVFSEAEPYGVQLQYDDQYRKLVSFNPDGPFVVEAHRIEMETKKHAAGMSVLWGDPSQILQSKNGVVAMDTYRSLAYDSQTGWSNTLGSCIDQTTACLKWNGQGENPCNALPKGWGGL